jgi:hypothetical protein
VNEAFYTTETFRPSGAAAAHVPEATPPVIVSPASLCGNSPPPREFIVPDWLPVGTVSGLFGAGGIGKSLLTLQLQTSTALGRLWIGLPAMQVASLGVYCEDSHDEIWRLQIDINASYQVDFSELRDVPWMPRLGERPGPSSAIRLARARLDRPSMAPPYCARIPAEPGSKAARATEGPPGGRTRFGRACFFAIRRWAPASRVIPMLGSWNGERGTMPQGTTRFAFAGARGLSNRTVLFRGVRRLLASETPPRRIRRRESPGLRLLAGWKLCPATLWQALAPTASWLPRGGLPHGDGGAFCELADRKC